MACFNAPGNRSVFTVAAEETDLSWHVITSSKMKATSTKNVAKKAKKKWSWKKAKGMPKRPLSAYNIFFARMRIKLKGETLSEGRKSSHKKSIGFAGLAKTIAAAWKSLDANQKLPFEEAAQIEREKYKNEIEIWKLRKMKFENDTAATEEMKGREGPMSGVQRLSDDNTEQSWNCSVEDRVSSYCVTDTRTPSFHNLLSHFDKEDCEFLISVFIDS